MIHIKGSTIKSRLLFAKSRGGEPLMTRLRAAPPPVGVAANAAVLSLRDFPLTLEHEISRFIAEALGAGPEIYLEMGAFSADEHRNLQKIVHGVKTDPVALLGNIPRQFPQYLKGDIGTARYESVGEHGGRIIWEGHSETYPSHCLSNVGYIVRMLENSGVTSVHGRNAECLKQGEPRCVWEFTWDGVTGLRRPTQAFQAIRVNTDEI